MKESWFVGECMVELRRVGPGLLAQAFAGDVYNTAVYFHRRQQVSQTVFVSGIGTDSISDALYNEAAAHGLNLKHVLRQANRQLGLYLIENDPGGERSFLYWRSHSAARTMLDDRQFSTLNEHLPACGLLYFSGITLAILDDTRRQRLLRLAAAARQNGTDVCFDTNFRPQLWADSPTALHWTNAALDIASHALVTLDDEIALHQDADADATFNRLFARGVGEVVIKLGAQGCLAQSSFMASRVAVPAEKADAVDTTAAGDSFNAAYLAARLSGYGIEQSAHRGAALAARVISRPGAIIAHDEMDSITSA